METGTGNPNTGRPGYESNVTASYKSNDIGLALLEADEDLQGGASEVPFCLGKLVIESPDNPVLSYVKGAETKAYIAVAELRQRWDSLYGPIASWNVRQAGGFIGRNVVLAFQKQGLLDDLEGWKVPINPNRPEPTSWWRMSGYKSNG